MKMAIAGVMAMSVMAHPKRELTKSNISKVVYIAAIMSLEM